MKSLHELSIAEIGAALRDGSLTSTRLTEAALERIARLDPELNAFVLVTSERAMADAHRADRELAVGRDRGPLHGVPYALKDIFDTAGIRTTCNSKLLIDRIPEHDAALEARIRGGGGVLLGKLNTHEFALGGPSFDLPFPPARNPWNPAHFTGGSSSGSGVAVAASFLRLALGSDTGGSIRSPACHCGVVGLKPSYGLLSRRGVYPLSYSLDHSGTLAGSVQDTALALNVLAGHDPLDPSSVDLPVRDYTSELQRGVTGLSIGYLRCFFASVPDVSAEVVRAMDGAAERLARLGADVCEVQLPDFELFKACGRLIMLAEAYAIHEADIRMRPFDYGRYTYQRIAPAAALSAADLVQAQRLRRELTLSLNDGALRRHHTLLTTTALSPAARLDEFPCDWPPPSLAVAVQTAAFNVTGNPALALPIGFSETGLPLGMQLIGRAFDEVTLLGVGATFEASAGVSEVRPALATQQVAS